MNACSSGLVRRTGGRWARATAALLCLCVCLGLPPPLAAQTVQALDSALRRVWTTRDGLPHNTVNAIAQTADGYLWIATWEGLVRFNGHDFAPFDRAHLPGMLDDGVRSLRVARDGSLWVGSARGGLARLYQGEWQFPPRAPALVTALVDDREGHLWAATEGGGVLRIAPDGTRQIFDAAAGLPADSVNALAEDAEGAIWVGTAAGLARIVGGKVQAVAVPEPLAQASVAALQVESDGGLLVGSAAGGYRLHAGQWAAVAELPAGESINSVLSLPFGERLFGSLRSGLFQLYAGRLARLDASQGLPNPRVSAIFRDRENNLWIGTNSGLVRLRDAPFAALTRFHGLSDNYVRTLLEDRHGALWIGTSRGLNRMRAADVARLDEPPQLLGESVLALAEAGDDGLWIGTFSHGLLRWRDGAVVERWDSARGLSANEVRSVLQARDGSLWVGTAHGLDRLVDGRIEHYGMEQGLPGYFVASLAETADGRIWVGTATGAAQIVDGRAYRLDLRAMDEAEFVFGFREDPRHGHLWLSTDRGLVRHRLSDGEQRHVGRAAGLPVEKSFEIVIDREGAFWLSSNRGVTRIAPGSADAVADGRSQQLQATLYGEADGMASAQCNGGSGPAAALRSDGSVWIATAVGVARVRPQDSVGLGSTPPPVAIEQLRIDGQPVPVRAQLTLPAGTRRLEIAYAGLSYLAPEWVRFRTRLSGFDAEWVERGGQRSTEFTNLPPGKYRFEVIAANPDSEWSPQPAVLELRVLAAWWQRPWLWGAALGVLVLLAALLQRWRIAQWRRTERRLSELVAQRTADLSAQAQRLTALDHERSELVERLRQQSGAFERQAREDALTGLLNRRGFDERVEQLLLSVARLPRPLCLALIDIDHFKRVNDQWSHAVGDAVLRGIADCLRDTARSADALGRWGGEELIVLYEGVAIDAARAACERIRAAVAQLDWDEVAPGLTVTVSIGVVERAPLETYEPWLQRTDGALYAAKQGGRNRVCG